MQFLLMNKMALRAKVTGALMIITIPMNELHHIWADNHTIVNPWMALDYPQDIQWYAKYLFVKVSELTMAFIIYRLTRLQPTLRKYGYYFLIFHLVDAFMFFYNWNKRGSYAFVYAMTPAIILFVEGWKLFWKWFRLWALGGFDKKIKLLHFKKPFKEKVNTVV